MRILRNYTVTLLPSYKCCPLKGDRLLVTTWAIVPLVKHPSVTGGKVEELRTWIIQLCNKLAVQPHHYPDDQGCLRYAVNRLLGATLNLIRAYVSENTGQIRLESLNALLDLLHQAFNDSDRTHTTNREIRKLKQKNGTFATYFAEFGPIMGDLNWNEEA